MLNTSSPRTATSGFAASTFTSTVRRWWPGQAGLRAARPAAATEVEPVAAVPADEDDTGAFGWLDSSFDLKAGLSVTEVFGA